MNDRRYKPVLKDLYKRLKEEIKHSEQWDWEEVIATKLTHYNKALALLELLESVTVFHIGLGADMQSRGFKDRVNSFKFLEDENESS